MGGGELLRLSGPAVTDDDVARACAEQQPTHIELHHCDCVTDLSPLAAVAGLRTVCVQGCGRVRYLGSLGQQKTALEKLIFKDTPITKAQQDDILAVGFVELVVENEKMYFELEGPAQSLVKASIDMIRDIVSQFNPEEIGVAFNGGKDSVVVMDLLQCALDRKLVEKFCLFTLGTSETEEFSELVCFREAYITKHGLSILKVDPLLLMKDGLAYVKKTRGIRLVFMGTRSSDSEHQTKDVEPTTAGWPEMLRASPVFHWGYKDIWGYTLTYNLSFCSLYLKGYTSVGVFGRTSPNSLLCSADGTFRPAWELDDASAERRSRCC